MAINKKKSRSITCNGRQFRWTVSPTKDALNFVAEVQGSNGRKIEILFKSDINRFWVEFPDVSDLDLKTITPKDASSFILQALQDGWNPGEKEGR